MSVETIVLFTVIILLFGLPVWSRLIERMRRPKTGSADNDGGKRDPGKKVSDEKSSRQK